MGNFGLPGLWLFLAIVLVVSILVGAASVVGASHHPEPVPAGHNAALSPFLTCVGLVYGALLGISTAFIFAVIQAYWLKLSRRG